MSSQLITSHPVPVCQLNMKTLISILALATCCLAAEAPYSPAGSKAQGALLLLPLQQAKGNDNNSSSTTPRPVADGTENLEDVNAKLSERLKQEQGSQQGEYHVYLQDGRLQKVQYTTAPITSGQQQKYAFNNYNQQQQYASNNYNQQQQYASNNFNQQQQVPEILSPEFAEKRGAYFVQVPQERIQAFQNYAKASQQGAQYQYPSPSSQYRQEPSEETPVVRYLPVPLTGEVQQYRSQEATNSGAQQAVLQYTEVQPIEGPVYSYSPQAFTRILRYAPQY
ncbi:vacuolar protein-sorting-associated protein 36 isoform X2 [Halyomorpha halys]|uniref:vacuolar protein-sorting-associated protein 36 isoform X2 n=1 Tax=Halyomorpha halys TaxID=286706 RepID=UPI0006D4DA44|nr:bromodomain-containing protein DDB_G0280777-like [Halyomorpha halys]